MSQKGLSSLRGYLYIALGLGFGLYRGMKVVNWGTWDYLDQLLAIGMIVAGIYIILKR